MEKKATFYAPGLKNRILKLMESENYMPFTEYDWKAIYSNLVSANGNTPENLFTEEQIRAEIEIFYNN